MIRVAESIHGTYRYHLSEKPHSTRALCKAWTMRTSVRLDFWGKRTHIGETWCKECERIGEEIMTKKSNSWRFHPFNREIVSDDGGSIAVTTRSGDKLRFELTEEMCESRETYVPVALMKKLLVIETPIFARIIKASEAYNAEALRRGLGGCSHPETRELIEAVLDLRAQLEGKES